MTGAGFQAGQVGHGAGEVGIVFCAPHQEFRSRFPRLAPDIADTSDATCTDLNLYVDVRGAPRLAEARLEGHRAADLLTDVGRVDLVPRAQSLGQHTVGEDLDQLHGLLREIFERAASPTARENREAR